MFMKGTSIMSAGSGANRCIWLLKCMWWVWLAVLLIYPLSTDSLVKPRSVWKNTAHGLTLKPSWELKKCLSGRSDWDWWWWGGGGESVTWVTFSNASIFSRKVVHVHYSGDSVINQRYNLYRTAVRIFFLLVSFNLGVGSVSTLVLIAVLKKNWKNRIFPRYRTPILEDLLWTIQAAPPLT